MLNLKKVDNSNIYSFEVSDDLSQAEMQEFTQLLEAEGSDKKIKLLGIFKEFPGFENFKAFNETLKLKTKAFNAIEKYALLTEAWWLEALLPVGNMLTPNIPMKSFKLNEQAEAMAWLNDETNKTVSAREHLTNMEIEKISGTNIYKFVIDENMDKAGVQAINEIFETIETQKINLLVVFKNFKGYNDMGVIMSGLKTDLAVLSKTSKIAILTDKEWLGKMAELDGKFVKMMDVRTFSFDKEEEATSWLKA